MRGHSLTKDQNTDMETPAAHSQEKGARASQGSLHKKKQVSGA